LFIPKFVTAEWDDYYYSNQINTNNGSFIFRHNENLIDVILEEGFSMKGEIQISERTGYQYYREVGHSMFDGCEKLESVYLPSTLKSIPSRFFEGCKIGHIVINGNLTHIANYAFLNCYDENKRLKITFSGRAPNLFPYDDYVLYSYLYENNHEVPIEITIEYDGTKAGWQQFKNYNHNLGSATLTWVDTSQN
jgi:hypothetical protein